MRLLAGPAAQHVRLDTYRAQKLDNASEVLGPLSEDQAVATAGNRFGHVGAHLPRAHVILDENPRWRT
jgi:hypothetical protein